MLAVAVVATAARALRVPVPFLLVLGGLLLALTPAVPDVALAPELIFLLFLPPLVYSAGFDTSLRDVGAQVRPILSLAVGLVLASTLLVGALAHVLMPEIGWPVAIALGAILSPTDAIAATALLRDVGAPRRVVTLLESESLFNDATALVAYQAALAAAVTASFSVTRALGHILVAGLGGVLLGLAVAAVIVWLRKRLDDAPVEITVSLLTPFIAAAVILVRLGWVFATTGFKAALVRLKHPRRRPPSWRETFVVGWAGLRGVVSLATALALPLATPGRDELLFITFGVILVTLL